MDPASMAAYLQLLQIALSIGWEVYQAVKGAIVKQLTPEEKAALFALWDEDVAQSAIDAGIPYVPPTVLPGGPNLTNQPVKQPPFTPGPNPVKQAPFSMPIAKGPKAVPKKVKGSGYSFEQ